MKSLTITVGKIKLEAELNESTAASLIWDALPFEAKGQTWGDEIYFRIPVDADLEKPRRTVEVGDLGYWPPGNAFCIFYGQTPASSGDEIVPASPVEVIGRVTSDVTVLKDIEDPGIVRVERGM